ncbi:PadR family transcriptional regulator [Virgisporangium aliadipatigenens]|uniref:PadR family transcriptional regulator n=2 Tax=Virgisporangium aliadipatigenens TaxID=741659 RepID=A0A8J3YIS4_9ACTN|nr:PadR family transcriptional regulator [Virgisporangium aliadipatigenens]
MVALTVLALLLTGPRHAYEMHVMIERTHKDFVTGLPRSIYHAAERLLTAGHIEVAGTARAGARPERTVYQLTDAGRLRLREWVRLLLAEPDPAAHLFVPALSFAGCLPPPEVAAALRARRDVLAHRESAARAALSTPIPRILLIEAEFEAHRLAAEIEWVERLVADLDSGGLHWSTDPASVADIESLIGEIE